MPHNQNGDVLVIRHRQMASYAALLFFDDPFPGFDRRKGQTMKIYDIKESGKRIKELRKAEGLSQEDLADKMGVERSFISRIETGERGCSMDVAVRLVDVLHTSLDYLVFGEGIEAKEASKEMDEIIAQMVALREKL